MTNKFERTRQRTNNLSDELIWGRTLSGYKRCCIIAAIDRYSGYRYFPLKKKVLQSSMP